MAADQPSRDVPIWRRLLDLGGELGTDWQPVRSGGVQQDPPPEPAAIGEAEVIEDGGEFAVHEVGDIDGSNFAYFLDGIEHTRISGYLGVVPLVHGYVAAVIRRRVGGAFRTWRLIEKEVLAFPHELVERERLIRLGFPDDSLIDAEAPREGQHPIRLAESGRAAVKAHRAGIERALAKRWADERPDDGWLLLDGRLAIEPKVLESGRAIGLVKSHRTQFLAAASMRRVLAMAGGQRSSAFRPLRPKVGEVYSWYLRLRGAAGHDIYWALARIEGRASQETLDSADEVSRWLLAETAPLSLPDPRWHVLLYPIRDCESFLRARMPTLDIG